MSEQINNNQITEAYNSIDEVEQLALRTGVQNHENSATRDHMLQDVDVAAVIREEDAGKDGVAYSGTVHPDSYYISPNLITKDAAIGAEAPIHGSGKNWKDGNETVEGPRFAKTHEATGTYTTVLGSEGKTDGRTQVHRADGKGGMYEATLQGANAEKAAAIIGSRAAKRVRRAIVDRTVKMADELKQEDNK